MSKDPEKKSNREQRKERAARLEKFSAVDNEKVSRAIRANEAAYVGADAQIGPGLNNLYAPDLVAKKVEVDLKPKRK